MIFKENVLIFAGMGVACLLGFLFFSASEMLLSHSSHIPLIASLAITCFILFGIGVIVRKREYFFFLYLMFFPFYSIYQMHVNISMLFAVLFIFIYQSRLLDFFKIKEINFHRPFYLLLFAVFISMLNSRYVSEAFVTSFLYISYFVVLLSFSAEIDSNKKFEYVYHIITIMLVFCGLITLYQIFYGVDSVSLFTFQHSRNIRSSSGFFRYPSIFIDAQAAGLFFSVTSILTLGFFSVFKKKVKWKIFFTAWGSFFLLLSGTRIAIAGFIISLFIFHLRKMQKIVCLISSFIITILFVLWNMSSPFLIFKDLDPDRFSLPGILDSLLVRLEFWTNGLTTLVSNPLGAGFGSSNLYTAAVTGNVYGRGLYASMQGVDAQFESAFFDMACSLGYIGTIGVIGMILSFFHVGNFLLKKRKDLPLLEFTRYLMASMSCLLICCLTSPLNREDAVKFLFVIIMGSMFYLYAMYVNQAKQTEFNSANSELK